MAPAIETVNLEKVYPKGVRALAGVTLSVPRHGVLAVAGPNGAGKTTALRILSTTLMPTRGKARILGWDVVQDATRVRQSIAVVPQEARPDPLLTPWQSVFGYLLARGLSWAEARQRAESALRSLGLWEKRGRLTSHLSGGEKRRTLIAMALATGAEVLLLDEPTAGLDPIARREVWMKLAGVREWATVVLTTHLMDEAEYLADQVAFLASGRLVAVDAPTRLKSMFPLPEKVVLERNAHELHLEGLGQIQEVAGRLILFPSSRAAVHQAISCAVEHGLAVSIQPVTLEDVYVQLLAEESVTDAKVNAASQLRDQLSRDPARLSGCSRDLGRSSEGL